MSFLHFGCAPDFRALGGAWQDSWVPAPGMIRSRFGGVTGALLRCGGADREIRPPVRGGDEKGRVPDSWGEGQERPVGGDREGARRPARMDLSDHRLHPWEDKPLTGVSRRSGILIQNGELAAQACNYNFDKSIFLR